MTKKNKSLLEKFFDAMDKIDWKSFERPLDEPSELYKYLKEKREARNDKKKNL